MASLILMLYSLLLVVRLSLLSFSARLNSYEISIKRFLQSIRFSEFNYPGDRKCGLLLR